MPRAGLDDVQHAQVTIEEQRVTVDDMRTLSTDPNSNKTARVINGKDLNMLSDDPNELAAELDALAGPAAGPSGRRRTGRRRAPAACGSWAAGPCPAGTPAPARADMECYSRE